MGDNHLKRETPFQCQIRFFNTLPEVSSQGCRFTALLTILEGAEPRPYLLLAMQLLPVHHLVVVPV